MATSPAKTLQTKPDLQVKLELLQGCLCLCYNGAFKDQ
jgi:hypothetical protein